MERILVKRNERDTKTNGRISFTIQGEHANPGIEFSDRTKLLLMWGPVYFINTMFTMERIQNEHGFQQCFASTGGVLVKEWGRVNSLIPGCDNSQD